METEDIEEIATGALPIAMLPTSFEQGPQLQLEDRRHYEMQNFEPTVNMGDNKINQNLRPSLQKFLDSSADPKSKAQALELLTALNMSQEYQDHEQFSRSRGNKFRPKTAMARLQTPKFASCLDQENNNNTLANAVQIKGYTNPYETTHNYFYPAPKLLSAKAIRPMSSQIQRPEPSVPSTPELTQCTKPSFASLYMNTTYKREFVKKADGKARPERAATATGVRNNNPHPSQDFLVWRYRRPMTATEKIESEVVNSASSVAGTQLPEDVEHLLQPDDKPELTDESYDRAMRGKCTTTYQKDFLGMPPGYPVDKHQFAQKYFTKPKFDKNTMTRSAFPKPPKVPYSMQVPLTRFHKQHVHNQGVIPSSGINKIQFGIRPKTLYETEINDRANSLMKMGDLRYLSNLQNAQAVTKMLENASASEKMSLMKVHKEIEARQHPLSIPIPLERRARKSEVGRHMKPTGKHNAWLSNWPGPICYSAE